MEDGLREFNSSDFAKAEVVLILVLMEDGLRGAVKGYASSEYSCLNPCFNGRWSASVFVYKFKLVD